MYVSSWHIETSPECFSSRQIFLFKFNAFSLQSAPKFQPPFQKYLASDFFVFKIMYRNLPSHFFSRMFWTNHSIMPKVWMHVSHFLTREGSFPSIRCHEIIKTIELSFDNDSYPNREFNLNRTARLSFTYFDEGKWISMTSLSLERRVGLGAPHELSEFFIFANNCAQQCYSVSPNMKKCCPTPA